MTTGIVPKFNRRAQGSHCLTSAFQDGGLAEKCVATADCRGAAPERAFGDRFGRRRLGATAIVSTCYNLSPLLSTPFLSIPLPVAPVNFCWRQEDHSHLAFVVSLFYDTRIETCSFTTLSKQACQQSCSFLREPEMWCRINTSIKSVERYRYRSTRVCLVLILHYYSMLTSSLFVELHVT